MAPTRRTQVLMEPAEFRKLQAEARRRHTSVADLIRSAVRQVYLSAKPDRSAIVDAIAGMRLPALDWKEVKEEIEAEHADLP